LGLAQGGEGVAEAFEFGGELLLQLGELRDGEIG